MSMMYCHKHDRHYDSDYDTECPECDEEIVLQIQLNGLTRTFIVNEDEINLNDWNDIIEDMLDTVEQAQDTKFLEV